MKTVHAIAEKVKGKVDILVNNAGMLDKESILTGALPPSLSVSRSCTIRAGLA